MNGQDVINQVDQTMKALRSEGFSLEDLSAIIGVTRPTATKYMYHPEMMTLSEFAFVEKFYSDYCLRKETVTESSKENQKKGEIER